MKHKKIFIIFCLFILTLFVTSCELPTYTYFTTTTTQGSTTTTSQSTTTTTQGSTTTTHTHTHTSTTTSTQEEPIVDNVVYDDLSIHFLELGNEYAGDSVYIKAGDADILIDAGSRKNSAATIKKYINQYCTDGKLEYVIATHAHQDHIAGFVGLSSGGKKDGILYSYEVGTIIDFPLTNSTTQIYEDYLYAVDSLVQNGTVQVNAADCFNEENGAQRVYNITEDITLEVLYNYYYFNNASDENDYSVCIMLNYKDKNFMFTGDLEEEGEHKMAAYYDGSTPEKTLPHVEVFKAGHHGSGSSSNDILLSKITPEIICVCSCAGSTEYTANYQTIFPTQEFINDVAKYTDRVYCTSYFDEKSLTQKSLNGDIIISTNGISIGVSATNNIIKLKDTTWFNETIYVKNGVYVSSGKGKKDFYTASTSGATPVVRRVWPGEK